MYCSSVLAITHCNFYMAYINTCILKSRLRHCNCDSLNSFQDYMLCFHLILYFKCRSCLIYHERNPVTKVIMQLDFQWF